MEMFEKATRLALRFTSVRGDISAEQLWELPLTSKTAGFDLDSVAKEVNRQLKSVSEESFVTTRSNPQNAILELKLDIVKHIIAVKLEEVADSTKSAHTSARRKIILEAIETKNNAELNSMSKEDLMKELDSL